MPSRSDFNSGLHPTNSFFSDFKEKFGGVVQRIAESGGRLSEAFNKLIQVSNESARSVSGFGTHLKGGLKGFWDYLHGTNFGKSLGMKTFDQSNVSDFASALGRFMASRAISGPANAIFEAAKNPLRDNWEINRAQGTMNSALTTLATTGSVTNAIISGVTSYITAGIMHERQVKADRYGFDQSKLDINRGIAEQQSDWAFNKIIGMYSRGEQIRMLEERATVRRGGKLDENGERIPGTGLTYDTAKIEEAAKEQREAAKAQKEAAAKQAESAQKQGEAAQKQSNAAGATAAAASGKAAASSGTDKNLLNIGLDYRLGSKALAALNEPEEKLPWKQQTDEAVFPLAKNAKNVAKGGWGTVSYGKKLDEEMASITQQEADLKKQLEVYGKKYGKGELPPEILMRVATERKSQDEIREDISAQLIEVQKEKKRIEQGIERKREWRRQRNLDPDTGRSLNPQLNEEKELEALKNKAQGGSPLSGSPLVRAAVQNVQEQMQKAEKSIADQVMEHPLPTISYTSPLRRQLEEVQNKVNEKKFTTQLDDAYLAKNNLTFDTLKTFTDPLARSIGKDTDHLTVGDVREQARNGNKDAIALEKMLKESGAADIAKFNKRLVSDAENGEFKFKDLDSLEIAMDAFAQQGQATDQNKAYQQIKKMYLAQERQAGIEEFEANKLKYDPQQIMSQYTEASRTTDQMARQGFFIGSQVDVQDVNKDILVEVKKAVIHLQKMATKDVNVSSTGFISKFE